MPQGTQRPRILSARERVALRKRREKRRRELQQMAKELRENAGMLKTASRSQIASATSGRFNSTAAMINRAVQLETVVARLSEQLGLGPGS